MAESARPLSVSTCAGKTTGPYRDGLSATHPETSHPGSLATFRATGKTPATGATSGPPSTGRKPQTASTQLQRPGADRAPAAHTNRRASTTPAGCAWRHNRHPGPRQNALSPIKPSPAQPAATAKTGGRKQQKPGQAGLLFRNQPGNRSCPIQRAGYQRLENWVARRALCRPTFLRSTSRASRVMKPALRSSDFRVSSYSTSARAMPRRIAPA